MRRTAQMLNSRLIGPKARVLHQSCRRARHELAYREPGAFFDERRLRTDLLASMPLTFNPLAPLKLDPALATRTIAALFPSFTGQVCDVLFEHSPGRGNLAFTGDGTAFDALLRYRTPEGRTGFIAVEIKYAEAMQERAPPLRSRYDVLTYGRPFVAADGPALRTAELQAPGACLIVS